MQRLTQEHINALAKTMATGCEGMFEAALTLARTAGLLALQVDGDGACLLRALLRSVYHTDCRHNALREATVAAVLRRMEQDPQWAALVAADMLGKNAPAAAAPLPALPALLLPWRLPSQAKLLVRTCPPPALC